MDIYTPQQILSLVVQFIALVGGQAFIIAGLVIMLAFLMLDKMHNKS